MLAGSVGMLGGFLGARRPALRFAPLLFVAGLGFGLGSLAAGALDYGAAHPVPHLAMQASFAAVTLSHAFVAAWVLFILWFPDGRMTGRGWQRFCIVAMLACAALAVVMWLTAPADGPLDGFYSGTAVPPGSGGPMAGTWPSAMHVCSPVLLLLPLVALGSLAQRYRRGSGVLREQVRWFLWGAGITVVAQLMGTILVTQHSSFTGFGIALGIATQPLPQVAATLAILRYRLWEIDLVVSRALVYGVLWAALSVLLLVPALAAGLLVGGPSAVAAVGIALLVTVVFHPARSRLEVAAQRLVYRHRTRPYVLLSGVWETVRVAGLDRIGPVVAAAVREGLQVEWAGLWLHLLSPSGATTLRPLGVAGAPLGADVGVSAATVRQLRAARTLLLDGPPAGELGQLWPGAPEAVVPLVAGDELIGLLACGARRGDRLRAPTSSCSSCSPANAPCGYATCAWRRNCGSGWPK